MNLGITLTPLAVPCVHRSRVWNLEISCEKCCLYCRADRPYIGLYCTALYCTVLQGRQAIYWATLHSAVWHFGLFKMNFHNDPVTSSYCHETCIGRMLDSLSSDQGTTPCWLLGGMVMLMVVVAGRSTKLAQIGAEQQQKAAVSPIWRGASRGQLTQSRHVCIMARV